MNQPMDGAPIAEFLRARLDDDEQTARAAAGTRFQWRQEDPDRYPGRIVDSAGGIVTFDEGAPDEGQAAHIVRHDPARVLRQTAVLRNRVDLWSKMAGSHARACLRELAAIWEDHPDYRQEWRL